MGARGTMSKGTTVTDRCAAACRPAALHRLPPPEGGWVGFSTAARMRIPNPPPQLTGGGGESGNVRGKQISTVVIACAINQARNLSV